jgi:Ca-activated chloride channel homolog
MMNFENEIYLYLSGIIPLLVIAYIIHSRWQKKITRQLGNASLVDKLVIGSAVNVRFFKFVLLLVAFAALTLSLDNPYLRGKRQNELGLAQTEIVFVVDVSKSMLADDVTPNRLAKAQSFMLTVVNSLRGQQAGIVIFAGKANAYAPLTSDYNFIKSSIKSISNNLIVKQGTSLSDALKVSGYAFKNKTNDVKVLCLLSDGEDHQLNFEHVADSIRKTGINLFAFGVGTQAGGNIIEHNEAGIETIKKDKKGVPVISHLHEESLQRVTGSKAGRYYNLLNKEAATAMFTKQLESLQRNITSSTFTKKYYFQLFLLIALILLIAEIFIT